MFGLTKREQRWAVQERDIKLILDAKRIAELEAWANRPVTDNTQLIANMEAQITDLEADRKANRHHRGYEGCG